MHRRPHSRMGASPPRWNLQRRLPTTDLRTSICFSQNIREARRWEDSFNEVLLVHEHSLTPTLNPLLQPGTRGWCFPLPGSLVGGLQGSSGEPVVCLPQPRRHSGLADSFLRTLQSFERLPEWLWQPGRGQRKCTHVENGTKGAEAFPGDHEASSHLLPG